MIFRINNVYRLPLPAIIDNIFTSMDWFVYFFFYEVRIEAVKSC